MFKKGLKTIGIILLLLIAILLFNTLTYKSKQLETEPISPIDLNNDCAQHLSEAVQIKTVSYEDSSKFDATSRLQFISFLRKTYPLSDSLLKKKIINGYSLLYKWEGKNASLKPLILMGHMDVVPAESEGSKKWDFRPFSGEINNGFVYGRGTMDDKVNVIGILEATELLLKENFKPERTIYFAFGHDEELGGRNGAKKIAEYLQSQSVEAEFILDEGLVITKGIVPGIKPNAGLIGISEKGYLSVELSVETEGGHSSMPAKETPIGILSSAIATLEKHPMTAHISEPVQHFLDYVGPEMPFFSKLAFANQWLLKSVIIGKYEKSNSGNASVRTTTAPTIFKSGFKDNVLPAFASATINFRILPDETSDDVVAHIEKVVNDARVKIKKTAFGNEATAVSDINSEGFKQIEKTTKQIFKNTLVAPALMVGATDEKHYTKISKNLFRFLPVIADSDDLKRIHGLNEKIAIDNFKDIIRFYRQLMLNSCK